MKTLLQPAEAVEVTSQIDTGKKKKVDFRFATSPNGHNIWVLKSWLQKSIRRGLEADALYCIAELDELGCPGAAWNVLLASCCEDVGLGNETDLRVGMLYQISKCLKSPDNAHRPDRLMLVRATLLCVRAPKNRITDDALSVVYNERPKRDVPDWVFDKHTKEGKAQGRGFGHFFDDAAHLENKDNVGNPYTADARRVLVAKEK